MAADIKQKILFQMGTVGTGAASKSIGTMALKFAAVTAAVGLAVNKLSKMYDEAVKFDSLVKNLNTDMSEFNTRTDGLIDTTASLEAAVKLQNAGLKVSKEQMAALGVAATKMNKDLGDAPEGATTQFNKLVKSVIMGTERGLIPFGIELSQTEDKAKASAEAMDALVEKFDGVSVSAESAKEKMFALNNSLGTVITAEFNGFLDDMSDAFSDLALSVLDNSDALLQYENDLIATEGQLARNFSVMTDLDSVAVAYNDTVIKAIAAGESNWIIQGRLIQQNEHVSDSTLENARSYIKERDAILESIQAAKEYEQFQADMVERRRAQAVQGSDVDKLGEAENAMRMASSRYALDAAYKTALGLVRAGNVGPFNEFDIAGVYHRQEARVTVNQRIADEVGGKIKRTGETMAQKHSRAGAESSGRVDALLDEARLEQDGKRPLKSQLGDELSSARRALTGSSGAASSDAMTVAYNKAKAEEEITAIEKAELDKRRGDQEKHAKKVYEIQQESAAAAAGLIGATSQLMNKNNEEGFKAYQTLAFSENAVSTALGARTAFNTAQRLGPIAGPVVGGINAAAVVAGGIATGREILSRSYNSKSSPSKPSSGAFPSGGSGVGASDEGGNTFNLAVVLNGSTVQQESFRQNQMEKQAGNPHYVMSDG